MAMLHANLATRPFYNERVVHAAIAVVALIVAALTVFNVVQAGRLSAQNTAIDQRIAEDERRAADLLRRAQEARARLGQADRQAAIGAAREANAIIDQRTFSWTELFNRIELTIPPDVMVSAIRPEITDGGVTLTLAVFGQDVAAVESFMAALEGTGAFSGLLSREEQMTDDGLIRATLIGRYRPGPIPPAGPGEPGLQSEPMPESTAGTGVASGGPERAPVARRGLP